MFGGLGSLLFLSGCGGMAGCRWLVWAGLWAVS